MPDGRLDLGLCVSSGQVFRWKQDESGPWTGVDGGTWYQVHTKGDRFEVESNHDSERFSSLFRLDWDASDIESRIVAAAPELKSYVSALKGLRLLRPSDPTEALFSFLCTPNNNLKRITKMVAHLASYGDPMPASDPIQNRFPRAERIAAISESELRAAGFGYRAATIPAIAKHIVMRGGEDWLVDLKASAYRDARAELLAIKGIGKKLADCICLFAFHHEEAVPIDTHMWQAVCRLYLPDLQDKPLTDARYDEAAEILRGKLGKLAGWGHQFLFYENLLNWRTRRATGTLNPPA